MDEADMESAPTVAISAWLSLTFWNDLLDEAAMRQKKPEISVYSEDLSNIGQF